MGNAVGRAIANLLLRLQMWRSGGGENEICNGAHLVQEGGGLLLRHGDRPHGATALVPPPDEAVSGTGPVRSIADAAGCGPALEGGAGGARMPPDGAAAAADSSLDQVRRSRALLVTVADADSD
jgi:hypothetical protein